MTVVAPRRLPRALTLTAVGLLLLPLLLHAQDIPSVPDTAGQSLVVRLITVGPGDQVWERFGHNALWIQDRRTGSSVAYDYGRFDFAEPGFLPRFVKGRMRYWTAATDGRVVLEFYLGRGRAVWVQELAMPPAARAQLQAFLTWNVREENRFYRYDYYRDNCSTRLRDALDMVLGGALSTLAADTVPGSTWRFHSDRLLAPDPLAMTGTKFGLGRPADIPISKWDEMYVPMKLQEHLREVTVEDETGAAGPLVRSEEALHAGPVPTERSDPPGWSLLFLAVGMLWGAIIVGAAAAMARDSGLGRVAFAVATSAWLLFAGLGGGLLLFLWLGTDHLMTRANENVLQLNPLAIALLVLLPAAVRRRGTILRLAFGLAAIIAGGALIGLVLKVLPVFSQQNIQIVLFALPINLAVCYVLWRSQRQAQRADAPA